MSVDLEALINESKARLGKHKEYLEKTAERAAGSSHEAPSSYSQSSVPRSSPNNTTNNNNSSRTYSPTRFNSSTSGAAFHHQNPTISPNRQYQQQYQQQRPVSSNSASHQQQQPQRRFGQQPAAGTGGDRYVSPNAAEYSNFNPYSSAVGRAGHTNFGEPQDGFGNSPNSQGRKQKPVGYYLTGRTPTKVYDRGQNFIEKRESFLEKQRQESWEEAMKGCTFSPFVSKKGAAAQGRATQLSSPTSTARSSSKKQQSTSPRNAMEEKDFLEWCVASDKSNVGFHVDAPSVFLHIQRQVDARKAKSEGESKLTIDTTHWKPKMTVPHEFHFGRSDQPIRSLRKPMLNMVRLDSNRDSIYGNDNNRKSKSPQRAKTPESHKSPLQRRKEAEDAAAAEELKEKLRLAELQSVSRSQKEQLREQNDEISRLNGMLAAMKRESEAAKAKVREMTLASTIQDGASK